MTLMLGGNRNGLPNVLFGMLFRSRIVLVLAVLVMDSSLAQQDYNLTQGYQCSGEKNSCRTYALYKTVDFSQTIAKVGGYFDADPSSIADLSGLIQGGLYSPLPAQQHLYIPLDCTCVNATMQKDVTHTILRGDTFWLLSITPYGNLTTFEAMEIANPTLVPTNLQIGQVIIVPIFCACPTTLQATDYGTKILLTYVVEQGDTLERISNYFNITRAELCAANKLELNYTGLIAYTILLVPLQKLPALSSIAFVSIDPTVPTPGTSTHSTRIIEIAAILGGIVFIVVVMSAFLIFYKKKYLTTRRLDHNLRRQLHEKFQQFEVNPTIFKYDELHAATNGFHPEMKLGEGGYGVVYKGTLSSGTIVAVKQLFIKGGHSIDDFCNEVVLITEMKHRNLVKLQGCCLHGNQQLLVYEFVENSDLHQALLERKCDEMTWAMRLKICLGVAHGLHYLHLLAKPKIIHRDIKASNILLDNKFEAKIADFGQAFLFPDEQTHILTSHVAGTMGYLAPEYAAWGQISEKIDVYSFGVVLLEVVSGRRNLDNTMCEDHISLLKLAWRLHDEDKIVELIDPTLILSVNEQWEVQRVIKIAMLCLQNSDVKRPTMAQVVALLQGDQLDLAVDDLESSEREANLFEKSGCVSFRPNLTVTREESLDLPLFEGLSMSARICSSSV